MTKKKTILRARVGLGLGVRLRGGGQGYGLEWGGHSGEEVVGIGYRVPTTLSTSLGVAIMYYSSPYISSFG